MVSPNPVEILQSNLLAFKVSFPQDCYLLYQIPRHKSLTRLEPSHQCENFPGIIVIQFVIGSPHNTPILVIVYYHTQLTTLVLPLGN